MIDKKLISQVQDLKENKNLSITEIAKLTGRGRTTIYKVLKEELNYVLYNRLVKNINQEETNGPNFQHSKTCWPKPGKKNCKIFLITLMIYFRKEII